MNHNPKVLLLATSSYAGMGPYVASIINSFSPSDNVIFFLVEREDQYYTKNIKTELLEKCTIYQEKTPSKLETLLNLTVRPTYEYSYHIKDICQKQNINIVHALSSMTDVNLTRHLSINYKLIVTVHDLTPHEANKAFYKEWKQYITYKRVFKTFEISNSLFTNSLEQLEMIRNRYLQKKYFYASFPSLITDAIIRGAKIIPELNNIKKYILFFGRIEAYKGLNILIRAFEESCLPSDIKLVIAGKGDISCEQPTDNLIFLNRYIDDQEIAYLYKNASCVVYPYISATQSGVLSIAAYFETPIIASDVPFFKEVLGESYHFLFQSGNFLDLSKKLKKLLSKQTDIEKQKDFLRKLYFNKYSQINLRNKLLKMYAQTNQCVCTNNEH